MKNRGDRFFIRGGQQVAIISIGSGINVILGPQGRWLSMVVVHGWWSHKAEPRAQAEDGLLYL